MGAPSGQDNARLRLDKWLWHARIVKSRTLAQKLVLSGAVRVDSAKTVRPDFRVGAGMVLTMNVNERLLVLKILALGTRRGPAPEAQGLYEDLSPPLPPAPKGRPPHAIAPAARDKGAGRPTKRARRAIDRFTAGLEKNDPD